MNVEQGVRIENDLLEPDYHAGEIIFVAPDGEGQYATEKEGEGVHLVGSVVGVMRDA